MFLLTVSEIPILGHSNSGWEAEHHCGTSMWKMTPVDMKQETTGDFLGIQRHLTVTYIPLARLCPLKVP